MPLHEPAAGSSTGVPTPPCPECKHAKHATPLPVHDLSPGIQYWSCGDCGSVWAIDSHAGPMHLDGV